MTHVLTDVLTHVQHCARPCSPYRHYFGEPLK